MSGREPDAEAVELFQRLIRNACVNDGTAASGQEIRSVRTLEAFFAGTGFDYEIIEPSPGRASLVGRIRGTDPDAPSLALVGHLDVVAADAENWTHDPFAGEIIDGTLWGRGAVDMLGLTSAMAIVVRKLLRDKTPLRGDLVFAAVADEEAGGRYGVGWIVEHRPELLTTDYALTENGGLVIGREGARGVTLTVGEKGGAPLRLAVTGRPGHGSIPFGSEGAAGHVADIVRALLDSPGTPSILEHWRRFVETYDFPEELRLRLLDESTLGDALGELGPLAGYAHALTHLTASPNVISAGSKRNVIPGAGVVELDVRLLPGQDANDAVRHVRQALGPLEQHVEIQVEGFGAASISPADTPFSRVIGRVFAEYYPGAVLVPLIMPGGTDGRHLRRLGTTVYGFGLYSPDLEVAEFRRRFHGNDERVDLQSIHLTNQSLEKTVREFLSHTETTEASHE